MGLHDKGDPNMSKTPVNNIDTEHPKAPLAFGPTKTEIMRKLLRRKSGASMQDLMATTGWQSHSLHGHLSHMRKSGQIITRIERRDGVMAYRLETPESGT